MHILVYVPIAGGKKAKKKHCLLQKFENCRWVYIYVCHLMCLHLTSISAHSHIYSVIVCFWRMHL